MKTENKNKIIIKNPHKIYIYKNPKNNNNNKIIDGQVDVNGKEKKQRKEADRLSYFKEQSYMLSLIFY